MVLCRFDYSIPWRGGNGQTVRTTAKRGAARCRPSALWTTTRRASCLFRAPSVPTSPRKWWSPRTRESATSSTAAPTNPTCLSDNDQGPHRDRCWYVTVPNEPCMPVRWLIQWHTGRFWLCNCVKRTLHANQMAHQWPYWPVLVMSLSNEPCMLVRWLIQWHTGRCCRRLGFNWTSRHAGPRSYGFSFESGDVAVKANIVQKVLLWKANFWWMYEWNLEKYKLIIQTLQKYKRSWI